MKKLVLDNLEIDGKPYTVRLDVTEDDFGPTVYDLMFVNTGQLLNEPFLFFKTGDYSLEPDEIKLTDIFSSISEDKGIGSLLLNYLFDFAKNEGYSKIIGSMHSTSETSLEKLEHFYKKNGFVIDGNTITKNIKE
ncbi:GNAT family N-acetyltransferase [Marinilactibacillus sp. XAAS-LB27]|uniref:GNAT family N-acetyltransferase n=1 Tax=Marinilactibacillus sp. XAAS-LB27 TaxID=3114538 RepID=UPI002E194A58|nr:GNAT family N-acetyltransferase [Marinilactibacillus sp. XAAS-LB27]